MKTQMVAAFAGLALLLASSTSHADQSIEQIYGVYCVQCHGLQRNGTGINVPALSVKPRDHTEAKGMGDTPDDELYKAIKEGGLAVNKSVLMPTWGRVLSEDQINGLVKYLRQVCKCGK
ncbi:MULTISPECIES: c-type cytochrome [unclassified Nitrobacter]|uniref:c-type cytochrome n=1 Tax=unclassified Nitrobacter TaxID=2620411 RepID=UPI00092AE239|nr:MULTISPECIES: cytochrome c [unclassified Nitrobacter]MBN9149735.1 cytochrome c [Nitrobacter sp.]OJV00210.1 MAG: cytochrome C [Nitrobacter sp. 62-23]